MECNKFNKYMKSGQKLMLPFNSAYCLPNYSTMKQIQKGNQIEISTQENKVL